MFHPSLRRVRRKLWGELQGGGWLWDKAEHRNLSKDFDTVSCSFFTAEVKVCWLEKRITGCVGQLAGSPCSAWLAGQCQSVVHGPQGSPVGPWRLTAAEETPAGTKDDLPRQSVVSHWKRCPEGLWGLRPGRCSDVSWQPGSPGPARAGVERGSCLVPINCPFLTNHQARGCPSSNLPTEGSRGGATRGKVTLESCCSCHVPLEPQHL